MNGNVFRNKTSLSRKAFRAYFRPFPFSSGRMDILPIEVKDFPSFPLNRACGVCDTIQIFQI